eukprot:GFUD01029636.1.p1 GENE.GFUD01029636.1~~GFUD01029636.1.p1  ORF type:complete len:128 (+),score=29.27 GFUD01029636.1:91-474(+)
MVGFRLVIVFVCLCIMLMNVGSSPLGEKQGLQRGKRGVTKVKVCGDQLVNMLRIICSHRGHKEKPRKPKKNKKKDKKKKTKKQRKGKKRTRSENLTIKQRKRARRKQGVVTRCCFSSCTIGQLYKAC